jgi:hypothetical protein
MTFRASRAACWSAALLVSIAAAAVAATTIDTRIDGRPPEFSVNRSPSISFSAGGAKPSRFECSLDSGGFTACTSPFATGELALGSHTFTVRAVDGSGRRDRTPAVVRWRIVPDVNPPVVQVAGLAPDGRMTRRALRNLRGTAVASSGVSSVEVALRVWGIRRQESLDGPTYCLFANLHRGKIVVSPCLKPRYVHANGKRHWRLRVARGVIGRLPPVAYELQVRAINAAGEGVIYRKKIELEG